MTKEPEMRVYAMVVRKAVWIDHASAIIVDMAKGNEGITRLESHVEPRRRSTGGVKSFKPYWHRSVESLPRADARHAQEIRDFFQSVARMIGDADELVVLGAGLAKKEFAQYLRGQGARYFHGRIIEIVSTPTRISERQILARARGVYGLNPRRVDCAPPGAPSYGDEGMR